MSSPPIRPGEFIWCAFPLTEDPDPPGPEHIVYVLAVSGEPGDFSALVAYTTSRTRPDPLPAGLFRFDLADAVAMGHRRPFLLNLSRLGYLPATSPYFPRLEDTDRGVIGRAPKALQETLKQVAIDLFRHRSHLIEQLGPLRSSKPSR